MDNFKKISYLESLRMFQQADSNGRRLKLGDLKTSKWLQRENINLDNIKAISRNYPDLRMFIIGEGKNEGFYVYSQQMETCFKFEPKFSTIKTALQ
ncbi:hypothetical protein ACUNWD_15575 [Sunxiuqinia sp. A32]|uniref:hypothetical protein n=1 Tax=Sunxiuqinia sp. A32 TaxID=3461496 RepID=UPI0040456C77